MTYTLLGIFSDRLKAESALNELETNGFDTKDISIIMREQQSVARPKADRGVSPIEGVATGITTGGLLGGMAGLLIGAGAIVVPGIGGLLIGGPIAVALGLTGTIATTVSGAAIGALAGGLVGALVSLGVSEKDAKVYESRIKDGGILLVVPVIEDGLQEAKAILQKYEADMIRNMNVSNQSNARHTPAYNERPLYQTETVEKDHDTKLVREEDLVEYQRPHNHSFEETLRGFGQNLKTSFKNLVR